MTSNLLSAHHSLQCTTYETVTPQGSVEVDLSLGQDALVVQFEVRQAHPLYVNPTWPTNRSVRGLWDFDVVELFVRPTKEGSYFEFQVSPLGQWFELEIFEPRKRWNDSYQSGTLFEASPQSNTAWIGRMTIPLTSLGISTPAKTKMLDLDGGLFAILGAPRRKTYWSAFLPEQKVADFHKPELFQSLLF